MTTLVVATYNVRHGLGRDGVLDFERCAAVIRDLGPDLLAVQELDRNMSRSRRVDQPGVLAELTGLHVSFFPTLARGDGQYGIAVASRTPMTVDFLLLPQVADDEPRGLILARTAQVCLMATHLSRSAQARRLQMVTLAEIAPAAGATIVAGDFNAPRRELAPLRRAGFHVPLWGPATRGRRRIDFIAARAVTAIRRSWAVRAPASDHDLLAAEVEL